MKISANYTEVSGPWGYGHQESYIESFEGTVTECQTVLHKALCDTIHTYQKMNNNIKDTIYDIMDYLRYCTLFIEVDGKHESRNLWNTYEDTIREIVTPTKKDFSNVVFDIAEEIVEEEEMSYEELTKYFDDMLAPEYDTTNIDYNEY